MKKILLIIPVIGSLLLMSGCSEHNNNIPYEAPVIKTNNTDYTSEMNLNYEDFQNVPIVTDLTDKSFVLIQGGSSSCPNVIKELTVNKTNKVTIVYEEGKTEQVCTMDFVLTATKIEYVDITIPTDVVTFETKQGKNIFNVPVKS